MIVDAVKCHSVFMFALTGPIDGEDGHGQRPGSEDERRGPGTCLRCCTSGQQVSLSLLSRSFLLAYQLAPFQFYALIYIWWMNSVILLYLSPCLVSRLLERQLRGRRSQWEEELEALRCQLSQAISGSSSAAQQQVSTY